MTGSFVVSMVLTSWLAQTPPPLPKHVTATPPPTKTAPATQTPPATKAAPAQPAQAAVPANGLKLRIGTATYLSDGQVLSASSTDWKLQLNQPVVAFATSGKSLCDTRAASLEAPADGGSGWRVQATPVRVTATELEVRVEWSQSSWPVATRDDRQSNIAVRRTFGFKGAAGGVVLTLHPGDRVMVDYLNAASGGFFLSSFPIAAKFKTADAVAQPVTPAPTTTWHVTSGTDPSCKAVGMGLEIGAEPAKSASIVEAELWLVRPNADGTEGSQRQVVRLPLGQPPASYYFEEPARLDALAPLVAKVSGDLSAVSVDGSGIHLNLTLSRHYDAWPAFVERPGNERTTRAAYRDLIATPGEVLAFKLPAIQVPLAQTDLAGGGAVKSTVGTRPLPQLSVRLRAQVVR